MLSQRHGCGDDVVEEAVNLIEEAVEALRVLFWTDRPRGVPKALRGRRTLAGPGRLGDTTRAERARSERFSARNRLRVLVATPALPIRYQRRTRS
jgi:hypothetical protein